jgi:hypothetical protein
MSGVIETGLIAGLAQLARALEGRRAALLSELRMVEQDLEAAQRTIDVAARMPLPASPPEAATRQAAERPAEPRTPQPSVKTKTPEPPMEAPETLAAYARTIQSLKTLRPNSSLMAAPPRVAKGLRKTVADVPMDGPELDAMRDSLAGLAEKVPRAPVVKRPGAGRADGASDRGHPAGVGQTFKLRGGDLDDASDPWLGLPGSSAHLRNQPGIVTARRPCQEETCPAHHGQGRAGEEMGFDRWWLDQPVWQVQ